MGAHRQGASLACQCRAVIWHESVVMGRFLVSALANSALCLVGWSAVQAHAANWCNQLVPRLPGVSHAECKSSSLAPSGAKSRRGFPILVRDIAPTSLGNPGQNKDTIRILLLGGIHGDELTSSALVFQWLQWVQRPEANRFHWKVAPILNPDGLLAQKPQRVNASGVDLNRNFPTPGWREEAPRYWIKRTGRDPRRYPGKAPLSEPESRWISEQIERFKPNVIISVHAPFGVLDFDGPAPAPHRFGRLMFTPVGVYPGSLGNYSGVHKNVPVITIELPNAQTMPPEAEMRRIWQDMLNWIRIHVRRANSTKVLAHPAQK